MDPIAELPELLSSATLPNSLVGPVRSSTEMLVGQIIKQLNGDIDRYVDEGLKIIGAVFDAYPKASDIQFRCDKHVRVHTPKGLEIIGEFGRLDPMRAVGCVLALYRCRSGARMAETSHFHEDVTFLQRMGRDLVADFACKGDSFTSSVLEKGRMRVHAFWETNGISATARILFDEIPDLSTLSFRPDTIEKLFDLCSKQSGIAFVTGQTGNGKSTTLAALINKLLIEREIHAVTIEDPIEYKFKDVSGGSVIKSLITQQEVGTEVESFYRGVIQVLRKRIDVVLIGEIRDRATMEAALKAAETGHLVLATLHTKSAPSTIGRIINLFDETERGAVLTTLSQTLLFVLSQGLMPSARDPMKRVLCYEFMVNNGTSSQSAIMDYANNPSSLDTWMNRIVNVQWDKFLRKLYDDGEISEAVFKSRIIDPTRAGYKSDD